MIPQYLQADGNFRFRKCAGPVVPLGRLLANGYGNAGKLKHCMTCGNVIFVKEND